MDPNDPFYPHYNSSCFTPYDNTQNSQQFPSYSPNLDTRFPPNPLQNDPETEDADADPEGKVPYNVEEDIALMSAWLYWSEDPAIGTNQKASSLWKNILAHYNAARRENSKLRERSIEGMRSRQGRLNKWATKWVACYREAYGRKTSGMSLSDVKTQAHKLYNKRDGFPHLRVYEEVMRHCPKWELLPSDRRRPRQNEEQSDEEGHGSSKKSRTDDDDATEATPETPVSHTSTINRPIGRDTAKGKGKGKRKVNYASSQSSVIDESFTDELRQMRITREKELETINRMGNEKMSLEKMKMDTNVLSVLLSKEKLSPEEEALKKKLMQSLYG